MKSSLLIAALAIAAAAGAGCEKRGQGPNPPTPTTLQHDLALVMAETPSTDPSLPDASVALAAAGTAAD